MHQRRLECPDIGAFVGASATGLLFERETRMTKNRVKTAPRRLGRTLSLVGTAALAVACGSGGGGKAPAPKPEAKEEGPFKSLEVAANGAAFSDPRGGVPLKNGRVAFLATVSDDRGQVGLFMQGENGTELLYSGEKLVNARDIDTSLEEDALLAADPSVISTGPDGTQLSGAILKFSLTGGAPELLAAGYAPVSITVDESGIYFSGRDPSSGEPGVFRLVGETVESVFTGSPLVDPSGIVVLKDGAVLVADTRLFESTPINSEAGVVRIKDGEAKLFASGFATGYPAGIAVTTDESTLIVSGEAPDRSDAVYLFSVADPSAGATVVRAEFSVEQNSSAGLKRLRGANTFIWASGSFKNGTVYKIKA